VLHPLQEALPRVAAVAAEVTVDSAASRFQRIRAEVHHALLLRLEIDLDAADIPKTGQPAKLVLNRSDALLPPRPQLLEERARGV
jgi:hypothetical protein